MVKGHEDINLLNQVLKKSNPDCAGIGNLKALNILAAYGNALRRLPESLTKLASLRDLWLQVRRDWQEF